MKVRAMCLAGALLVGACGGTPHPVTRGVILLSSPLRDAELYVNDDLIGTVGDYARGIAVKPGLYRIEIRHEGYYPRFYELTIEPDERERVEIDLAPLID